MPQTSWAKICCLNQTPPHFVCLAAAVLFFFFSSSSLHPDMKQSRPRPWEVPQVTYLSSMDRRKPPTFPNDSSFNSVWFSITCCACEKLHRFCFLAEALPTTELNYESLAGVWKYIIKRLNISTILFGSVCVCNIQLLVHSICK